MLKKLVLAAFAVLLGLFVLGKTDLLSYMRLGWKKAEQCARQQVPVETEIERLRQELDRMGSDSKEWFSRVAEKDVEVRNLDAEIQTLRTNLEKQERSILTMRNDLKSGNQTIVYGDNKYSRRQVEGQLKRDWKSYQRCKTNLQGKEKLLESRKASLDKARQQLLTLRDAKERLRDELEGLETEVETLRLAQTRSQYHFDDSEMSRVKEGIARLRSRIQVEQKKLELQGEFSNGPVRVDAKSSQDVLKEIDTHFDKTESQKVAADNE